MWHRPSVRCSGLDRNAGDNMKHAVLSIVAVLTLSIESCCARRSRREPNAAKAERWPASACLMSRPRPGHLEPSRLMPSSRATVSCGGHRTETSAPFRAGAEPTPFSAPPASRAERGRVQRRVHVLRNARSCNRRQSRQTGVCCGSRSGRLDLRQELRGRRSGRAVRRPSGPYRLVHELPRRVPLEEHGESAALLVLHRKYHDAGALLLLRHRIGGSAQSGADLQGRRTDPATDAVLFELPQWREQPGRRLRFAACRRRARHP